MEIIFGDSEQLNQNLVVDLVKQVEADRQAQFVDICKRAQIAAEKASTRNTNGIHKS